MVVLPSTRRKPENDFSVLLNDIQKGLDDFTAHITADSRRTLCGPFDYGVDNAYKQGQGMQCVAENGLLFQLTLYFRYFTAGQDSEQLQRLALPHWHQKRQMPKFGQPRWSLSRKIINAILPGGYFETKRTAENRMGKILRDHPKISFRGWPQSCRPGCQPGN